MPCEWARLVLRQLPAVQSELPVAPALVSTTLTFRYMNRVTLPDCIRNLPEMRTLGQEATLMCLIINDLYSAPKEIV